MIEVPFGPIFAAFGLAATVTVEGNAPVATKVVWITPSTPEVPEGGTARSVTSVKATRREARRVLVVQRTEVPALPRGSVIVAPERYGGTDRTWTVDSALGHEADHIRVLVNPARD